MASVVFKIKESHSKPKEVTVSFDADKFERVAAGFGMFSEEFLSSLVRAEADVRAGRVKKIKNLVSLRK